jgi:beta-lactamase class A
MRSLHHLTILLLCALLISACSSSTPPAARTPATEAPVHAAASDPAAEPPTAVPTIASGVTVGGVDIGGLTLEDARAKLASAFAEATQPISLQAGDAATTLIPGDVGLKLDMDATLAAAQQAGPGASITPQVRYDEAKLRSALEAFGQEAAKPSTISVITDTEPISRSFALTPGQKLDVAAAMQQIVQHAISITATQALSLPLVPDTAASVRPSAQQLQEQIEAMAAEWNGVIGMYVYDLDQDQPVAKLNADTVFSGASVMKVPILLNTYLNIQNFTPDQKEALEAMIIKSDNLAANDLLAASVGGQGTDDAYTGVQQMNDMLSSLGLNHTYQSIPYEAYDYLVGIRHLQVRQGPPQEGPAPYTEADPFVRTTPAEMSEIFLWIYDCSRGKGLLLDKFPDKITPERCRDMLGLLKQNDDHIRMVAGFPPGTDVAHKSGWTEDMHSDVGVVRSPGGNFLLGIYVYRQIVPGKNYLADEIGAPVVASFARLAYTFYNPVILGAGGAKQATGPAPEATVQPTDAAPTATSEQATTAAQSPGENATPTVEK